MKSKTLIPGVKKNRLTIIEIIKHEGKRAFICKCDCGNKKIIKACNFTGKRATKSCGCAEIKHGHSMHGKTREYSSWDNIRRRCDLKYSQCRRSKTYIELVKSGKAIDPRWFNFKNFLNDMGLCPKGKTSIDRIDNSKGYWKDNCRWANQKEQNRNKISNIYFTHENTTLCLKDWITKLSLNENTVRARIRLGWPIKKALDLYPSIT